MLKQAVIGAALVLSVLSPRLAAGATFVVDSALDAVDASPGDGVCATDGSVCTLRAAIQEANALAGAHDITLPAGTYTLTIPGQGEFLGATGDLNILSEMGITINGAGATTTIVDANRIDRAFNSFGGRLTLNDVTVQNGKPDDIGGCFYFSSGSQLTLNRAVVKACDVGANPGGGSNGGAIILFGAVPFPSTLVLTDTTIALNVSTGSGGGVSLGSGTSATMIRTTISGNAAPGGAGIAVFGSATNPSILTVSDTTITQNVSTSAGGGVSLSSGTSATLIRTTISGNAALVGAGIAAFGSAANPSTLTVTDTTIAQNASTGSGGGVLLGPGTTATISRTTISGNTAPIGAGIDASGFAMTPSTLALTDTGITQNVSTIFGAGIYLSLATTATISRTTISGNSAAAFGGGIYFAGSVMDPPTLTVANSTISGNSATDGAAILFAADAGGMTLTNVTIASNASPAVTVFGTGLLQAKNTIIANSTGAGPANCSGSVPTDLGNNLEFPGTTCGFGLPSDRRADPLLGPLAANGGVTQTHALTPGSPAIRAGDAAACDAAPVAGVDQRGVLRLGTCDIGAYAVEFTDDPLIASVTPIKAVHATELRTRIDAVRARYLLGPYAYSNSTIDVGTTVVMAMNITQMRQALLEAYTAAARTPPIYTTSPGAGVPIVVADIAELRAAVIAIQ